MWSRIYVDIKDMIFQTHSHHKWNQRKFFKFECEKHWKDYILIKRVKIRILMEMYRYKELSLIQKTVLCKNGYWEYMEIIHFKRNLNIFWIGFINKIPILKHILPHVMCSWDF